MQATPCDAQVKPVNALRTSRAATAGRKPSQVPREPSHFGVPAAPMLSTRPPAAPAPGLIAAASATKNVEPGPDPVAGLLRAQARTHAVPRSVGKIRSPRKQAGNFLAPSKGIISTFKLQSSDEDLKRRLDVSDLAHRMSFNDIQRTVNSNGIGSVIVDDLTRVLTVPSRDFGPLPKGDESLYRHVKEKAKDANSQIKMLNSSPLNLRPGDASTNRSIGDHFDPVLNTSGRRTPLSSSLSEFGEKYPGSLTAPLPFDPAVHDRPANVAMGSVPSARSSTSVTAPELSAFENHYCERLSTVRGTFGGAYPSDGKAARRE